MHTVSVVIEDQLKDHDDIQEKLDKSIIARHADAGGAGYDFVQAFINDFGQDHHAVQ